MLPDDSLQTSTSPPLSKRSSSPSFQLVSACAGKKKHRQRHESNTTDSSSSRTVIRRTTAWRWVIVFGSFGVHFVADGLLFSFGMLMHAIKDDLKLELHTVGIIASLFASLPLLLAPLCSAMVNKVGCRVMTMLGGLLCTIGLFIGSYCGNFVGALVGIGIISGIGLSFVYVPAVVIVAHYFDDNRAIATAVAVGGTGIGNAVVAQLIHVLNDYYDDWRDTTLFLSGVLFTIVLFGALFRPAQFEFHEKDKNYHHTMNDIRLPPSCMTSMEKLQRFVNEMDKQCALRQTNQQVSISLSNNERLSTTIDENDSISIANESDLFDSYSADDITDIQHDNSLTVDMTTFREKISNDMRFINERWKKIAKKQGETGTNSKLFRMPNFRYLISNKNKERNNTLVLPNQNTHALIEKINPLSHCTHPHSSTNHVSFANEQKQNKTIIQTPSEDIGTKKETTTKSENIDLLPISNKEIIVPGGHATIRFRSLAPAKQEEHLLQVYYQPINQKDIFYPGNVPTKSLNKKQTLSTTSCPDLVQSYFYEESATSISSSSSESEDADSSILYHRHRRLLFYRKGLSFLHTLRRMLGLQLFRDYRYVLIFISQFLFYLFYDLIYFFPVDYGETVIGYTKKQMTMLVTILGVGQFFGQLFFGILANYSFIDELILYNIGAILCSVASCLIPFVAYSYVALIMTILLFGLAVSANYALTSIILANMCGLELLTSAYGLILLGQGLSSLFGPVLGGWIAEHYGYKTSLIVAGIFMGLSGCVTTILYILQYLHDRKKHNKTDKTVNTNMTIITSDNLE
ncbi:unnamed protein product [Rotaria magnacalcarata]|uniref:Major facilitator superfamily (MFS) profile domain-containing protein n=2 Tax=Rotaria magnacalcarata TaxID=392030 RepID=A0A816W5W7_9BILA|nr:unnamed protein product [Rotaria magnacalcarata]CAF1421711.1 unnamed protein product [Rotaria magnacalcarata]CAF2133161.1 unnamed protein product [Rotaria magnacalcarata]CAF4057351.1 unnamed protein product [Rotaria magnacalcarata]